MMKQPLEWKTEEFEYIEKSTDWFWAVGIITAAFAFGAILLENILFAIVIVLGAGALTLHALKRPRKLRFRIDKRGVYAGDTLYPFPILESFWVEDNPARPQLILESQKLFMPHIYIPLGEVDPESVRAALSTHLEEKYHEEPISHEIMRMLGFHH